MMNDDFGTFNSVPPDCANKKADTVFSVLNNDLLLEFFEINFNLCELQLRNLSFGLKTNQIFHKSKFNDTKFFADTVIDELWLTDRILYAIEKRNVFSSNVSQNYSEKIQNFRAQALNLKKTIAGR